MSSQLSLQLNQILADYQILYQKSRSYHWNVTGPLFFQLHAQFEELYTAFALRGDEVAERIAALEIRPLSSFKEFLNQTRLEEDQGETDPNVMVRNLVQDLESLDGNIRGAVETANGLNDATTANVLEAFADEQQKSLWMLKSFLRA